MRPPEGTTLGQYILYIYYEFVRQGTKQQKCTSTNIDKSKSDMHDQRDLELQLIMSRGIRYKNWLSHSTCARDLEKNCEKNHKSLYFTYVPRDPLRTDCNQSWHRQTSHRGNEWFKTSCDQLRGLSFTGGRQTHVTIGKASRPGGIEL
jgi:hypothetical protein